MSYKLDMCFVPFSVLSAYEKSDPKRNSLHNEEEFLCSVN